MATYRGTDGAVYIGTDAVGEVRSFTLDETAEVISANVMGDTHAKNKIGLISWTVSVEAYFDDADAGQAAFEIGTAVALKLYPTGNTSGNIELSGTVVVNGKSHSQSHDGMIEISFSGTGDGALTKATVV